MTERDYYIIDMEELEDVTIEDFEKALVQLNTGPGINEDVSEEYNDAVDLAIKLLEREIKIKASLVKLQTSKIGQWIERVYNFDLCSAECSHCGKRFPGNAYYTEYGWLYSFYDHCPNCGAKMTESEGKE